MELLFDQEVARRYDSWYLSPMGRYVERVENDLLLDLLRPQAGQSLLDVGCGTGNHLLLFHQLGLDVTGLDPSVPMLQVARDKLGDRVDLHQGIAEDLPFDDNSFDIVTLITSLEFCTSPLQALAEVFRVARQKVVIGVLNRLSANGVHRKLEALVRPSILRSARFFSVWELRYMIKRVLGVCRMEWGSVIWLPLPIYRWDAALNGWVPRLKNPLGAFLGMKVEILYTHQALLRPLESAWRNAKAAEAQPGIISVGDQTIPTVFSRNWKRYAGSPPIR